MRIEIDECLSPFIETAPCIEPNYYVYKIMSGTVLDPETILIVYEDNTFRILKEGSYQIV